MGKASLYVVYNWASKGTNGVGWCLAPTDAVLFDHMRPLRFSEIEALQAQVLAHARESDSHVASVVLVSWTWVAPENNDAA